MRDSFGRKIEYMRISITDRCNLRCTYCMPHGIRQVPMNEVLTYEEILKVCKAATELGITRFKITGGEPLVRLGCADLIRRMKEIPRVRQVTLTTNGILLGKYLDELVAGGVDAVNVSLDTLDRETYEKITGFDELENVKESIARAYERGVKLKINCVLQKGVNDGEWQSLLEFARERKIDVRFIEMMPIGYGKQCLAVSGTELLGKIKERFPTMEEDKEEHGNGPAIYYRIPGFSGSVGFISAIHGKFCDRCNRIRLTATGELKPCLCYGESVNLKAVLRRNVYAERRISGENGDDAESDDGTEHLRDVISRVIQDKPREHCFESEREITEHKQMVQIGG